MKTIITITLESEQIEALDTLVNTGKYASRSHIIRVAVEDFLAQSKRIPHCAACKGVIESGTGMRYKGKLIHIACKDVADQVWETKTP